MTATAFLECHCDAADDFSTCTLFRLRWCTPTLEIVLCGHATLAAAAAIMLGEGNPAGQLVFETLSGRLSITRQCIAAAPATAGLLERPCSEVGTAEAAAGCDLLSLDMPLIDAAAAAVPRGTCAVVEVSLQAGCETPRAGG